MCECSGPHALGAICKVILASKYYITRCSRPLLKPVNSCITGSVSLRRHVNHEVYRILAGAACKRAHPLKGGGLRTPMAGYATSTVYVSAFSGLPVPATQSCRTTKGEMYLPLAQASSELWRINVVHAIALLDANRTILRPVPAGTRSIGRFATIIMLSAQLPPCNAVGTLDASEMMEAVPLPMCRLRKFPTCHCHWALPYWPPCHCHGICVYQVCEKEHAVFPERPPQI